MTTQSAIAYLVKDAGIQWNKSPSVYVTSKGKPKAVVSGVPGSLFWFNRKKHGEEVRANMAVSKAWLKKGDSGWEVLIAITSHNLTSLATSLCIESKALAIDLPEQAEQPF